MAFKVIANSKEEFEKTFENVNSLQDVISDQIVTAEKTLMGFECRIRNLDKIFVPHNTTNIKIDEREVLIFTKGEFFFRMERNENQQFEFIIVQEPK